MDPLIIDDDLPEQIVDLQLRAGDTATDKEGTLFKLVKLGDGPGPEVSHNDTCGIIRVRVKPRAFPP